MSNGRIQQQQPRNSQIGNLALLSTGVLSVGLLGAATTHTVRESVFYSNLEDVKRRDQPGDVLYFERGGFDHVALYLGDGKVMNVCGEGKKIKKVFITERSLEDVCKNSKVRIKNHDKLAMEKFGKSPKPVEDIIRDARNYRNDTKYDYNFLTNNCEHHCLCGVMGLPFPLRQTVHLRKRLEGHLALEELQVVYAACFGSCNWRSLIFR